MKKPMLWTKLLFGLFVLAFLSACKQEAKKEDVATVPVKKPAIELIDSSMTASIRTASAAFEKGDIDGFTANFSDSIQYTWSGRPGLKGKQAVKDYYSSRWKLIDSLKFVNHIFLPLVVNESVNQDAPAGKYVMQWSHVKVKYKNGKKLDFWIHQVNHVNDGGQIDWLSQYIDFAPLMEATKDLMKKKQITIAHG